MTELYNSVVGHFVEDDERIFINRFKSYVNELISGKIILIDFDEVYEYIGFSTKGNAKRLLIKNFEEKKDYHISNDLSSTGRPNENIMMTSDTFKMMCMLADTDQGRKVRSYYVKLEKCVMDYIIAQNDVLRDMITKTKKKPKKVYELGPSVYIWRELDKHKVGSSGNMNSRADTYKSHSRVGEIVFVKRCVSEAVLESCVHHILRDFVYESDDDWFVNIPQSVIERVIIETCEYIDNNPIITEYKKQISENTNAYALEVSNSSSIVIENNEPSQALEIPAVVNNVVTIPPKNDFPLQQNLQPDFTKFIEECFEIETEHKTHWIDIRARYRLWSRSTAEIAPILEKYLKDRGFIETFIFDPETKINAIAYKGLKMIPLPSIKLSENPSDIEKFIYENCVVNVTGRASCKDLGEAFVAWKNDPSYTKIQAKDKKALNSFCNQHFLASTVHTGERIRFGFYGLSLKGKESAGRKSKPGNRKIIEQVDANTNQVVNTYDSITHAANALGITISAVSLMISGKKNRGGYLFRIKS